MKTGMNLLLWTTHVKADLFPLFAKLKARWATTGVECRAVRGRHGPTTRRFARSADNNGLACTTMTCVGPKLQSDQPGRGVAARDGRAHQVGHRHDGGPRAARTCAAPNHSAARRLQRHGAGPTADESPAPRRRCGAQAAEHAQKTQGIPCSASDISNRFECYFLSTGADAKALVKAVNHPLFRTMYDTFHAHIEEKHAAPVIESGSPTS